jgi:hypothetical protein
MSDFPTVDRVIADLKRLAGGPWATDREREIGNAMVDARHCLEQLLEDHKVMREGLSDLTEPCTRAYRVGELDAVVIKMASETLGQTHTSFGTPRQFRKKL